ncbi:hypothetical protein RZE82_07060 [Mollicutes bacterium LVI A0039]|nr:hypothetical protein RZE82_07060 [Mollicutes bacterium LVI A0039]
MNYTKVVTHKDRTVIPFINVEVRGELNFFLAIIPASVVFVICYFIIDFLALAPAIVSYVGLVMFLSDVDSENNSYLYKQYLKFKYKEGIQTICWFEQNVVIIKSEVISCSLINYNHFRRLDV